MLNPRKIESIEKVKLKIYEVKHMKYIYISMIIYFKNSRKIVNATGIKDINEIIQFNKNIENIFDVDVLKINIDSLFLR